MFVGNTFAIESDGSDSLLLPATIFLSRCLSIRIFRIFDFFLCQVMMMLIETVLPEGYFDQTLRALSVDMAVLRELMHQRLPKLSAHLDHLQRMSGTGYFWFYLGFIYVRYRTLVFFGDFLWLCQSISAVANGYSHVLSFGFLVFVDFCPFLEPAYVLHWKWMTVFENELYNSQTFRADMMTD